MSPTHALTHRLLPARLQIQTLPLTRCGAR